MWPKVKPFACCEAWEWGSWFAASSFLPPCVKTSHSGPCWDEKFEVDPKSMTIRVISMHYQQIFNSYYMRKIPWGISPHTVGDRCHSLCSYPAVGHGDSIHPSPPFQNFAKSPFLPSILLVGILDLQNIIKKVSIIIEKDAEKKKILPFCRHRFIFCKAVMSPWNRKKLSCHYQTRTTFQLGVTQVHTKFF